MYKNTTVRAEAIAKIQAGQDEKHEGYIELPEQDPIYRKWCSPEELESKRKEALENPYDKSFDKIRQLRFNRMLESSY